MQAMILAAGLGTRLRPLTFHIPKPLFPVLNQPLVERLGTSLAAQGFSRIFINTYHLAESMESWHAGFRSGSATITLVREPELLGTGGGIRNVFSRCARRDMPLLVINGDVVTDIDLKRVWDLHCSKRDTPLASMVLHSRSPWNKVRVQDGSVLSFEYHGGDALAFTGISVLSPGLMANIPEGPGSIITAIETAMVSGGEVRAIMAGDVSVQAGRWIWEDVGTPAGYLMAHERLIDRDLAQSRCVVADDAVLPQSFRVGEWVCIGNRAVVEEDVRLDRCVVWANSVVPAGTRAQSCVFTPYGVLRV